MNPKGWFRNTDNNKHSGAKNFVRTEEINGEIEWVLMDHEGAGAIVRTWMPWHNPKQGGSDITMRIYLDGASEPSLQGNMLSMFEGKELIPYPLAHTSLRSAVNFFPIPYAKRCKVTTTAKPFFHQLTYREYDAGAPVKTFAMSDFEAAQTLIQNTGQTLLNPIVIEAKKDGPFFVYLAHTMPHTKLAASSKFKDKSAGGLYGDVIQELDFNVGRVLDKVSQLGLDDNTYIIFTSDNGPWLIRKDHGGHAAPLRSGKTSCWEGGLRVPCIMRAPGRIPAGTQCDAVAATIDLLPTLANLAGASAPSDRVIDGLDSSKLMHGEANQLDRNFFYYQHDCLRAVRLGKWKLMVPHTEPARSSILVKWKRHVNKANARRIKAVQLFDLDNDIGENTNVAKQNPEVVAKLKKLAMSAKKDIGDHDRFGENARTFGAQRRTLSN